VVIDTASILTDVVLSALDNSDVIILVTTQDIPAIKNVRLFLDLLQTMGIDRDHVVLAMNKIDKRYLVTPEKILENLKLKNSTVIPLDERIVIPAVNRGVPFMLDNTNRAQPAAKGIFALAGAVRTQLAALDVNAVPVGKR
jgi:pilus assembly protein CpaE